MLALRFIARKPWLIFACCWILLFLIYLPAARSGMVGDTVDWLRSIRDYSFHDYVARSHYSVKSLYGLTQTVTWVFYRLFGTNPWPWHLLHLTLHCINVTLLFILCRRLFEDAAIPQAALLALAGAVLYATSPYMAEVIVWEASYHFLQGFLIILLVLLLVQAYMHGPEKRYPLAAGVLYLLSTFSLELFYITPLLAAALIFYYRAALRYERLLYRRALLYFLAPQVFCLLGHAILFRLLYGPELPHIGKQFSGMGIGFFAIKPPEYLFHLLWGRFLPQPVRDRVHELAHNHLAGGLFYAILGGVLTTAVLRFRNMTSYGRTCLLLLCWMGIALSPLLPLAFPDKLLSLGDRYLYLLAAFYFMLAILLLNRVGQSWLKAILWLGAMGLNICLTVMMAGYWNTSTHIIHSLETSLPLQPGKTVLMLNNPSSYKGIIMIGCTASSEFKLLHNLFYRDTIPNRMADVMGYNMASVGDGAMVRVLDDTTVRVTLTRADPQRWFGDIDGTTFENEYYKITRQDTGGSSYDLALKGDTGQYELIYQRGSRPRVVDLKKKGIIQY